jgi:hypothetical protein
MLFISSYKCCGSEMLIPDRVYSIPDPNFFIPDPGSASKNISILTPKKWFLNSRKYDPGCSSRIRIPDPDPDFLLIPDPGSRGQKGAKGRGKGLSAKFTCVKSSCPLL